MKNRKVGKVYFYKREIEKYQARYTKLCNNCYGNPEMMEELARLEKKLDKLYSWNARDLMLKAS